MTHPYYQHNNNQPKPNDPSRYRYDDVSSDFSPYSGTGDGQHGSQPSTLREAFKYARENWGQTPTGGDSNGSTVRASGRALMASFIILIFGIGAFWFGFFVAITAVPTNISTTTAMVTKVERDERAVGERQCFATYEFTVHRWEKGADGHRRSVSDAEPVNIRTARSSADYCHEVGDTVQVAYPSSAHSSFPEQVTLAPPTPKSLFVGLGALGVGVLMTMGGIAGIVVAIVRAISTKRQNEQLAQHGTTGQYGGQPQSPEPYTVRGDGNKNSFFWRRE